uniref:Uncharacterized protein n=1 Tax=Psilocybe cubensis TaxID=181762 RepID=A0A8H8CK70_PSICU
MDQVFLITAERPLSFLSFSGDPQASMSPRGKASYSAWLVMGIGQEWNDESRVRRLRARQSTSFLSPPSPDSDLRRFIDFEGCLDDVDDDDLAHLLH